MILMSIMSLIHGEHKREIDLLQKVYEYSNRQTYRTGMSLRCLIISLASGIFISACTSQQLYDGAQGARLNECTKLADNDERTRCFAEANKGYQQYRREKNEKAEE